MELDRMYADINSTINVMCRSGLTDADVEVIRNLQAARSHVESLAKMFHIELPKTKRQII